MAHEGFTAHIEDVELEHQELPHLEKHEREPSLTSQGSAPAETTWAMDTYLNLPRNLTLALGFLVSSTMSSWQANLCSIRVGLS